MHERYVSEYRVLYRHQGDQEWVEAPTIFPVRKEASDWLVEKSQSDGPLSYEIWEVLISQQQRERGEMLGRK